MSLIKDNRDKLASMQASQIDCIKLSRAGHNKLALVACLVNGSRLQLSNPQFEFQIRNGISSLYVTKHLPKMIARQFVSVANGYACINMANVSSFETEDFGSSRMVNINAKFESGNSVRLYSVPTIEQGHEIAKLSKLFSTGESEIEP